MSPVTLVRAAARAGAPGEQGRGPVGRQLPVPGQGPDQQEAERVHGRRDAHHDRQDRHRVLVPAPAEQLGVEGEPHDQPRDHAEERRHRDHRDVLVRHVRQLVRQHALQLRGLQPPQQPGGDTDHRVVRVAAGGEGVGHLHHRDHRLRHVGHRRQPVHHPVQLRILVPLHDPAAHREQRDPVGEPVLRREHQRHDHHDQDPGLQQRDQRGDEPHVQQAEQEQGDPHAHGQSPVTPEAAPHLHHLTVGHSSRCPVCTRRPGGRRGAGTPRAGRAATAGG
ncbi:hypothetical protein SVIOM342S_04889 [Streptomyces violaceorubidus]